jgi:outer membrane receptor protein involved in Fe transport
VAAPDGGRRIARADGTPLQIITERLPAVSMAAVRHFASEVGTMKRILVALLALSLVGSAASVQAQTPAGPAPAARPPAQAPGEIRGTIVDAESGSPVASASVEVRSRADSSLVTGAVARADGTFRVEGLRPGSYFLRVSGIGYAPQRTEAIAIAPAAPRASAGTVKLARAAVALEGLTVTAERSSVAIAPDRNTYRAKDVAPAGGTASDVLQAVPSVEVDGDGKVSLRGNENVAVQINGRPAPIGGAQLAGYLKQLPANLLERVEVVPNPSAKYDPEGMAGIINIVLKQNADLGVSGGFLLGGATAERYTASGNLGYQSGPLTAFFSYGYNSDLREFRGINDRELLGAVRSPTIFTEQDITGDARNAGHNLSTSVDYRLGDRDVLSSSLLFNLRGSSDASLSSYSEWNAAHSLLSRYDRIRDAETDNFVVDYTLAFKRTLEPQRHELATEVRLNRARDEDRADLWLRPLGVSAAGTGAVLESQVDALDALTYQLTAQADYTRSFGERSKLETGYKGTARWLDRDFSVVTDSLGSGVWTPSGLSNDLEFDERVNAVYGVLSHGAGKVEMQAGLRAEHAARDFSLAGGASYPHDYTSLFPSALVAYNLSDATQLKLSYSRRVRRPGTQELNPFPVFMDAQNVFLGDPGLNAEYTDAVEAGFQRSGRLGSVQVSPFYRRTTDVIRIIVNTADTVAGREVTSVSFRNLDTGTSWGSDVNGSLRLGKAFSGLAGFNVFRMVTDGTSGAASLSSDAVTWSARVNGTYNLSPRTSVQAMYFYRAPMEIEGGRFHSVSNGNLSIRQKVMGEKGSVTLRVSDPFDANRFRVEAGNDNVFQLTERRFNSRAVHLTFQYNFGQAPKIRQRPQPQEQPATPGFPG